MSTWLGPNRVVQNVSEVRKQCLPPEGETNNQTASNNHTKKDLPTSQTITTPAVKHFLFRKDNFVSKHFSTTWSQEEAIHLSVTVFEQNNQSM